MPGHRQGAWTREFGKNRGFPGLGQSNYPACDGRGVKTRGLWAFKGLEWGAALPGMARLGMSYADAVSHYLSLLSARLRQAQSQPHSGAGQQSRDSQESGHATARRLVPRACLPQPRTPSLRCPITHQGWPGVLCWEGDWYRRCFHLLCVIPRALTARGRSGQASAQAGVTQGKDWLTIFCCGSAQPAASAPVPFPPPSPLGAGQSGCCCGHVAAVPKCGAREALRNLLLLHRGCVNVPGCSL